MLRKTVYWIFVLCFTFMVTGCATIMQGTNQSIGVSSIPSGAKVTVNNFEKGTTPVVVDLKRKEHHIIRIELPGYVPYEVTLTRKTSGWVWGNLAFGGLIGLCIDAISGGMYKLTPEQVQANLQKEGMSAIHKEDALLIAVVMTPDPSWKKIGQLEKIK